MTEKSQRDPIMPKVMKPKEIGDITESRSPSEVGLGAQQQVVRTPAGLEGFASEDVGNTPDD